ncbi:MAG: DUF4407 domain-containing protein, partial [Gammaproteobacteria bacterium]|nr:DUF4407 domain-containing protein [Gammaproteobacteria bacterium]
MQNPAPERSRYHQLLTIACWITRSDSELARLSNKFDQLTIIAHAELLVLLFVLALLVWTAFAASFLPLWAAIPIGLLIGALIYSIDRAISASDWELAGVLRNEPHGQAYWIKTVARILIASLLAQATAVGATLWMFSGAISNRLHDNRAASNAPVEAEYTRQKAELKARLLDPIQQEITARQGEREVLHTRIESAQRQLSEARALASEARIESGREQEGGLPGYVRGKGPRWQEAKRQENEAYRLTEATALENAQGQARIVGLGQEISLLTKTLEERNAAFRAQARELDLEKLRDPRWLSLKDDPLLRWNALDEIENDPKSGPVARKFGLLMTTVLLTLELSFLFVKVACAPASVYTVRLITRTKHEAARESA